ncbi:MAG: dihydrofolate reductase [Cytophagales bacterium]|nr:MAG: dihydrofolate reductase [Cytophagales bacterium]
MLISLIAAVAENNAIGKNNQMPWHLTADLQYFKKTTTGHIVLMGRKTFLSIGRALPQRLNFIVSRQKIPTDNAQVFYFLSIEEAIAEAKKRQENELFVIGGAEIYQQILPLCQRIYLTKVHTIITNADAFFPIIDPTVWKIVNEMPTIPADEKNDFNCTMMVLERK